MKRFIGLEIIVLLLLLLFLCSKSTAQEQKDTLFLYKGQRLIGEFKKMDLGYMSFDDDDLNLLKIKISKIESIKVKDLLRIETTDKHLYYGRLYKGTAPGHVAIILGLRTVDMELSNISSLTSLKRKVFSRVDGKISAGYTYARSSKIGQLNFDASALYITRETETQFSASSLGTVESSGFSRDRENVQLGVFYYLDPTWFVVGLLNYQHNLELSIARRYQELAGAGNKFLVREHCQGLALTGLAISQEKSTEGVYKNFLEIPARLQFNLFHFQDPNLQLSTTHTFYYNLTQTGRLRYDSDTKVSWEMVKDFTWNLELYTNFDSKPPVTAAGNIDYGIVFGVGYKF